MAKSAHRAYVVANEQPALIAVLLPYWARLVYATPSLNAGN
jgi:hypothetical protein